MDQLEPFVVFWLILPPIFLVLLVWALVKLRRAVSEAKEAENSRQLLEKRYSKIISVENEIEKLEAIAKGLESDFVKLRNSYADKRLTLKKLEAQVAIYDERLSFSELGVYEPHFDFNDSEAYKSAILACRERQKEMITAKAATICPTNWTVDGSKSKGQAMINRQTRLTMRAFNGECEAAISNARWNNVNAMEKRIQNAAKQINSANESMNLVISDRYVSLKLEELYLTHEYRERLKVEREERAEMARAEREEKKLLAEADAAEREEKRFQLLLEKARAEAKVDEARIAQLEAALEEAHARTERARAMAEMTKSGYVYIISNVGSFGEDVVKIGLTRRLDPDDRVRELGDASVPFDFDTHAMIYSEDAPALEAALHRKFGDLRVNNSNLRKEFFRVSLEEVEAAVAHLAPTAAFFKDRQAQEWHETLARRNQSLSDMVKPSDKLPEEL